MVEASSDLSRVEVGEPGSLEPEVFCRNRGPTVNRTVARQGATAYRQTTLIWRIRKFGRFLDSKYLTQSKPSETLRAKARQDDHQT